MKRYGAMLEAAERADQLLGEGDMAGAEMWHVILYAIERLQRRRRRRARRWLAGVTSSQCDEVVRS